MAANKPRAQRLPATLQKTVETNMQNRVMPKARPEVSRWLDNEMQPAIPSIADRVPQ